MLTNKNYMKPIIKQWLMCGIMCGYIVNQHVQNGKEHVTDIEKLIAAASSTEIDII